MRRYLGGIYFLFSFTLVLLNTFYTSAQPQLTLYSNYNSIGYKIQLPQNFDADTNATVLVTYYSATHSLDTAFLSTRLYTDTFNQFRGSLFFLDSNALYHVQVILIDSTPILQQFTLSDSITTRFAPVIQATGTIYYVCDTCNSNQYTLNQPGNFAALIGSGLITCGTTVILKGGDYDVGEMFLNLTNDCSEFTPIVIMAFPGDTPVLNGGYSPQLTWTPDNNDTTIYNAPTDNYDQYSNLCLFDSTLLYPYAFAYTPPCVPGYPSLTGLDYRLSGFCHNANSFQIKTLNQDNPNQHHIIFSKRFMCLKVTGNNKKNYLYIKGLTFKYYAKNMFTVDAIFGTQTLSAQSYALNLIDVNNAIIDNCKFFYCGQDVTFSGHTNYNTVQNCYSKNQTGTWSHAAFKETREVANIFGFCLYPSSFGRYIEIGSINFLADDNMYLTGNIVRNNIIDGHVSGMAISWPSSANSVYEETDLYNNEVFNCYDAFDTYNGQINLRIFNNTVHHNPVTFSNLGNFYGPRFYIRNVAHHILDRWNYTRDGIFFDDCDGNISEKVWGTGMKMNPDSFQARSGYVYLLHNTFYSTDSLGFNMNLKNCAWRKMYMRNNIWYSEGISNFFFDGVGGENYYSFDSKNDNYFNALNGIIGYGVSIHNNSPCQFYNSTEQMDTGLRNLTGSAGIHVAGFVLPPDFKNTATNDFHLKGSSAVIDKGIFISGINNRSYNGSAPDIGAYEHYKVTSTFNIADTISIATDSTIFAFSNSTDTITVRDTILGTIDSISHSFYSDTSCAADTILINTLSTTFNSFSHDTLDTSDTLYIIDTSTLHQTLVQIDSVIKVCATLVTDSVIVYAIANGIYNPELNNLLIYPNPATDKLLVSHMGPNYIFPCIVLIDITGKRVLQEQLYPQGGTISINLADIESGIYSVQLTGNNMTLLRSKLIIQH